MCLTRRIKVCKFPCWLPLMAGCSVKLQCQWVKSQLPSAASSLHRHSVTLMTSNLETSFCSFASLRCAWHVLLDFKRCVVAWHVFWLFVFLFKVWVAVSCVGPRSFVCRLIFVRTDELSLIADAHIIPFCCLSSHVRRTSSLQGRRPRLPHS